MCGIRQQSQVPASLVQVLKDETTLAENKVTENTFMVVMVKKVGWAVPSKSPGITCSVYLLAGACLFHSTSPSLPHSAGEQLQHTQC